jgi:hypothetical protein
MNLFILYQGCYSPSTGLDCDEWEMMFQEFVALGLVVKSESDSD